MRFNHLHNPLHSESCRQYENETAREPAPAGHTDSPENSPPRSPRSSGMLEWLDNFESDRPRSSAPDAQRRDPAPRIDLARAPQVSAPLMPTAEMQQRMMTVREKVEGPALVTAFVGNLLQDFDRALSSATAARRPDISVSMRNRQSDSGRTAFDTELQASDALRGAPTSAVSSGGVSRLGPLNDEEMREYLAHPPQVSAPLMPPAEMQQRMMTVREKVEGPALVTAFVGNLLQDFDRALSSATAARRPDISVSMRNRQSDSGRTAFDTELQASDALRGAPTSAVSSGGVSRLGPLNDEEMREYLAHPPQASAPLMPPAEMQQRMMTVREKVEGPALVTAFVGNLLQDFDRALSSATAARRPDISVSMRNRQSDSGCTAFDTELQASDALRGAPASAVSSGGVSRWRPLNYEEMREYMMYVPAQLRQGHALETVLNELPVEVSQHFNSARTGLSAIGHALVASYGQEVLEAFNKALGLPSASRRPSVSAGKGKRHAADLHAALRRPRQLHRGNAAPQPQARASGNSIASHSADPEQTLIDGGLVKASSAFLRPDTSMADIARAAGVSEDTLRTFLTDTGLSDKGFELVEKREISAQAGVIRNVQQGLARRIAAQGAAARPASPAFDARRTGQQVMGLPGDRLPAYASTPSWEVTGSPRPALSADCSLLGSRFSHWPGQPGTLGEEVMGPPASPLPADSDTTFGNLGSIASPRYRGTQPFHLDAAAYEDVTGPAAPAEPASSSTTFGDLESLNVSRQYEAPSFDLNADADEVTGPAAPALPAASDTTFRSLGSLGSSIQRGDLRDDAQSSAWNFDPATPLPSGSGSTWPQQASPAHHSPLMLSNLPVGQLRGVPLDSFLAQVNAERGHASALGLNCLLDSLLQLVRGERRWPHYEPHGLSLDVQALREVLVMHREVASHGEIDAEGANLLAVTLAANYQVRIQFIEAAADDSVIVHPVYGNQGRLVHILHTPGHFQPLWPKR